MQPEPNQHTVEMHYVYLSLGSNLGDRLAYLKAGLDGLRTHLQVSSVEVSNVYETAPWGKLDQPGYLNCCARIRTSLSPEETLSLCLAIERKNGRQRTDNWGARTLDLDLLIFDDLIHSSSDLILPHPHLGDRRFVLKPLADLASELIVPRYNQTIGGLLESCGDDSEVVEVDGFKDNTNY
jgi:2-amino-4-hydroxy-6-hydroxymethyldihydropteridine diphosphokinase